MATIKTQDGKVVLKDGKASCTCCGGEIICPDIEVEYDVISEEMYNALEAGGNYVANGSLYEPGSCNMSASEIGIISEKNCGASITVQQAVCQENGYTTNSGYAYISFGYSIKKTVNIFDEIEYRFTYGSGSSSFGTSARCPWNIITGQCYSLGYSIGWWWDNVNPNPELWCPIEGGGITLNTSAGTLGPFGIYTFCGFSSTGSLDITITPFP